MKLLVTGGAGFIGSNFIRYWIKNHPDDEIVNLDKLTYAGHLSSTKDFSDDKNYTFIKGDIANPKDVKKAMVGVDVVVHFAAESHVDRSVMGPKIFTLTNVVGTQVLLDEAMRVGVKRFHHISTDEVFGELELGTKDKFSEDTPYDPKSPYSASKAASDHLVRAYHNTYKLPITITNCSNNYGPYQSPEKFIPRMITNLIDGGKVPIYGDGKYVRDWLHVEDHVRAIELVLEKGKLGETYVVGGLTKDYSNLDIAKRLIEVFGKDESDIKFVKDRPGHDRRYAIDWSKINNELGWEPKHSMDEWLEKNVKWYKENEDWWRPLKKEAEDFYKKTGQY
jgi:dTDP-glucose 4,6-dehydratase